MSENCTKQEWAGQLICVGIDVHVNSWTVCVLTRHNEYKVFTQPPEADKLANFLRRSFPGADYACAYEAGYCGFWPQRRLEQEGLACIVVHPLDVPAKNVDRRRRNNKNDARRLARNLRNGELEALYVPTEEQEQDRALVRRRSDLVRKQTRCKNQITAQLHYYGIAVPEDLATSRWSGRFITFLKQLEFSNPAGRRALDLLLKELECLRELLAEVLRDIRALAKTERYREDVALLAGVPGFALVSSMVFLTEIMELSRFHSLDELCSYVGLVPDEDSTGDEVTTTGITRRRNAHLRHIMVQCTWTSLRKDPVLQLKYQQFASHLTQRKGKAIIGVARKLLARVSHVLKQREPYQVGRVR